MTGLLPGGTVLVVEDDPFVRAMAKDMFHDFGCDVLDAYNAVDALAVIAAHPEISLAFIDVRMPGEMNGVALAIVLKETRPDLKVVLTSGYQPENLGAFEFLPKPWQPQKIAGLLQHAMARRSSAA